LAGEDGREKPKPAGKARNLQLQFTSIKAYPVIPCSFYIQKAMVKMDEQWKMAHLVQ